MELESKIVNGELVFFEKEKKSKQENSFVKEKNVENLISLYKERYEIQNRKKFDKAILKMEFGGV